MKGCGILPVKKPAGMTSFDVVRKIKKLTGIKKVGHTGTLDKFAEGLMIILLGSYTKLASYLTAQDKEYIAEIQFGITTETLDPEGLVVDTAPEPTLEAVQEGIKFFTGEMDQVPPLFSAVHHEGERAYKLARQGKEVTLKSRKITIYEFDFIDYQTPFLVCRIKCSKGTYIRSLARDLGVKAGSCGFVKTLKRTAVGPFRLEEALGLEEINEDVSFLEPYNAVTRLENFTILTLKKEFLFAFFNGGMIEYHFFEEEDIPEGIAFVFDRRRELLGVIEKAGSRFRYHMVIRGNGL